jgi:hypothetical protein
MLLKANQPMHKSAAAVLLLMQQSVKSSHVLAWNASKCVASSAASTAGSSASKV